MGRLRTRMCCIVYALLLLVFGPIAWPPGSRRYRRTSTTPRWAPALSPRRRPLIHMALLLRLGGVGGGVGGGDAAEEAARTASTTPAWCFASPPCATARPSRRRAAPRAAARSAAGATAVAACVAVGLSASAASRVGRGGAGLRNSMLSALRQRRRLRGPASAPRRRRRTPSCS